jgi:glutamine synthetase
MSTQDDAASAPLSMARLQQTVDSGHVDTVLVCFTDMQGRLQGKRVHAKHFLSEVMEHGTEACNYLLAVDVDMNTVDGYQISSWDLGYGDFVLRPDMSTLRAAPWWPSTAMVQCDLTWLDGSPVRQSPRQILRAQVERTAALGCIALAGTELEFMIFEGSYEEAWDRGYRNLTPANRYNVDYSVLGTSRVEGLLRDIRNAMYNAGLTVESAKGECNYGQHEIAFKYAEVLRTADQHAVYKTAAKELAVRHGRALTFMAKFDEREGNSCHIHMSLRGLDGSLIFVEDDPVEPGKRSRFFTSFVAGILATMPDFTLLYAPNVNSYKRFQPGSFAPTAIAWGEDNRTCSLRVVGHGESLRVENRVPGGDVNPYLGLAAMLAGGLWGIQSNLALGPAVPNNAYHLETAPVPTRQRRLAELGITTVPAIWTAETLKVDALSVPTNLRDARDLFAGSMIARSLFGDDVVDHYVNMADVELSAHDAKVSDWERYRGFERL